MKSQDLFSVHRTSKRLNESLQKVFGKKINLENFDLDQLHDARNKLRTQISQIRDGSGFNENLENDAFHQAQWMLDAINAEIAERDEHIIEAGVEEGKMKDLHQDVEEYLTYMSDVLTDQERYDLSHEFHELAYKLDDIGIGGVMKEINRRANETGSKWWKGVSKEFSKKFGKFAEGFDGDVDEGQTDVDYELHQIARSDDEEELIDAMEGLKGAELQIALEDMMSELKDELAAKGMNDVINDQDKMIEMLMDKVIDEYGEDGEEYDDGDMGDSDADADALKSAGFGSDEDYESINNEVSPPGFKGTVKAMKKHDEIDNPYALAWHMKKKGYKSHKKADGSDKNESVQQGEEMTTLGEGEVQQASAIVTAKTMVDRVGRWIEELSGMENDTLLQLGDSIRDEMGQEQAKNFISAVAPAIQQALENLKTTRETLATGVRQLTGEEQAAGMLGAEPAAGAEGDMAAAPPDEMNMPAQEPAADEFAAAEPAAGVPKKRVVNNAKASTIRIVY